MKSTRVKSSLVQVAVAVAVAVCPVVARSASAAPPNFDAFLRSGVRREVKRAAALSPGAAQAVASGRLGSVEPRLGVPTFFWAGVDESTAGRYRTLKLTPEQAARRYLLQYGELYGVTGATLADATLNKLHDLGRGAIVASFRRDLDGTPVFRDELRVVMNQQLDLVALSGYLTPARKVRGEKNLTVETAVTIAFQDLTGRPLERAALKPLPADEGGYQRFALVGQPTPVRARQTYYGMPEGLVPAYYVELDIGDEASTSSDYFSFVISAADGSLLSRKDLTQADSYSYRVWADDQGLKAPFDGPQGNGPSPHPTGTTNQYNPPFVSPQLVALQNGPISTNDPWLPAGATETVGNNASAYADIVSPSGFNAGDVRPVVTAPGVFDRTYDVALNPESSAEQRMAAVTQLFYDVNFFHDWYYDVGFDEKAGNAQNDNFGRGGVGNDAINAEGQDFSGRSNANMSTPSDGARPRMQMFIFDAGEGPKVQVDGTGTSYNAGGAAFGPQSFTLSGQLVLVDDGDPSGQGGSVNDGCQLGFASAVAGKIAYVDRGGCTFLEKVNNAESNGAIGIIIGNNANGGANPLSGMGTASIPALSVSRNSAAALKMAMAAGTVTVTLRRPQVVDRDGTIDNGIVAHEWGHYISNRLIGNGNGISNVQAVGMGEGWGDFHSLLLVVKEGDDAVPANVDFTGVYAVAAYTSYGMGTNGYYFGIRRYPYSTDMTKNPLTFKHIAEGVALPANIPVAFGQSGRGNSEVHATGEVWATMLWECYASLLRDKNRLTFAQANDAMRAYLVAAYKATPQLPTFVEARDALLAVAAANDLTDFALFSASFAKRGLGTKAVAPDRDSPTNSPVTESFMTGNSLEIADVRLDDSLVSCDQDGALDNGEKGKLTVTVKNTGVSRLDAATATVVSSNAALKLSAGGALAFAPMAPYASATASLDVELTGVRGMEGTTITVVAVDPALPAGLTVQSSSQFRLNYDAKPSGSTTDDVEAAVSTWVIANNPNGNTSSDFRRYQDSATSHWFFGPNPASPADTYLISPELKVSDTEAFSFSFMHRYEFEADANDNYDGAVVEISTDGRTWADLGASLSPGYSGQLAAAGSNPLRGKQAFVGKSANYPAFEKVTAGLGTTYAGKTVRVRFRIGADDAVGLKGWELDDLAFTGLTNAPFASVSRDPNTCFNTAPTVANGSLNAPEHSVVQLIAVGDDAEGDALSYIFTQVSGEPVTLDNASFAAPEVPPEGATLTFSVVASDGKTQSAAAMVEVHVQNVNRGPDGQTQTLEVQEGDTIEVAAAAVDPDGDAIVAYRWEQIAGPTVTLDATDQPSVRLTAPQVDADVEVQLQVIASDAALEGTPGVITVTVHDRGQPKRCGCGSTDGNQASIALMAMGLMALLMRRRRQ